MKQAITRFTLAIMTARTPNGAPPDARLGIGGDVSTIIRTDVDTD